MYDTYVAFVFSEEVLWCNDIYHLSLGNQLVGRIKTEAPRSIVIDELVRDRVQCVGAILLLWEISHYLLMAHFILVTLLLCVSVRFILVLLERVWFTVAAPIRLHPIPHLALV